MKSKEVSYQEENFIVSESEEENDCKENKESLYEKNPGAMISPARKRFQD